LFHISIASKFHVVIIFLSWLDVTKLRRNLLESAARTKLKHLCSFQPVHFLTRSCLLQVRSIEQCARCYGLNWCTLVAIDILVVFSCSALLVCDYRGAVIVFHFATSLTLFHHHGYIFWNCSYHLVFLNRKLCKD
jgi:hypothetical protein